jgi:hypothetical protein
VPSACAAVRAAHQPPSDDGSISTLHRLARECGARVAAAADTVTKARFEQEKQEWLALAREAEQVERGHVRRQRLLDDLMSPREQRARHIEPEGLRGLQVDHKLVFSRRLHRKVGGLLAFQDAVNVVGPKIMGESDALKDRAQDAASR